MDDKTNYETGARKFVPGTGPDPSDEFSQDAAENSKPENGMGLSRKTEEQAAGATRTPPRR